MGETFKYDVFLRYSSKDRAVVRQLAERLKKDGLGVWFDQWEIRMAEIASIKQKKIDNVLAQLRTLVSCMSENVFASELIILERHTDFISDKTLFVQSHMLITLLRYQHRDPEVRTVKQLLEFRT